MSFPSTPTDNQYHITGSNKLYKYNLAENYWLKIINPKEEILNQVDFDIRNKALVGTKRGFGSNSKLETEVGLDYNIVEENFSNKWIVKDKITTTLNFSNEVIPQNAGIPGAAIANADSVYVYVNNKIYAKCYKGVNDVTYSFGAGRVLLVSGNTLTFAIAIGSDNAHWDNYGCRDTTDITIRLDYYAEGYQEETGITQYVNFEDGNDAAAIDTQYNKSVELPTGTYTPYKQNLKYPVIPVLSGLAADSANFFYKPEGTGYNSDSSVTPFVLKENGIYKMWFSGNSGSNFYLLYSTSTDKLNWTTPIPLTDLQGGTPGLVGYEGTYDVKDLIRPCIIKDGNLYKMWYESQNAGSVIRILYTESTDGIKWETPILSMDININGTYDTNHAAAPYVIKEDDGTYKMWYSGHSGSTSFRILYTTSKDGKIWEVPKMIIDIGDSFSIYTYTSIWQISIIKENGIYKGWLTGLDSNSKVRIIYVTSTDGLNWNNSKIYSGAGYSLAIDINENGVYDTNWVASPTIVKEENSYNIWYQMWNGVNGRIAYTNFYPEEKEILSINSQQQDLRYEMDKKIIPVISGKASDVGKWFYKLEASNYNLNVSRMPCVIKDGSTYKMWFTGVDITNNKRILYSTSTDCINWSTPILVLNYNLEGVYDANSATTPFVLKDGDTYKMWYGGYSVALNFRTMYTTSVDGINWTTPRAVNSLDGTKPGLLGYEGTYDTSHSYYPCIMKDGNIYKNWYSGSDGTYTNLLYSTSKDGIIWDLPKLVMSIKEEGTYDSNNHIWAPKIIKDGKTYKMFYMGRHIDVEGNQKMFLLYSTSTNGINWEKPKVFSLLNNIEYIVEGLYDPFIIKDGDIYKMWVGFATGNLNVILGYSEFTEKDISLALDRDNNSINLYKSNNNVIQSGIADNLFLDQDMTSQTNGVAIGGDWTNVNNFQASNVQANSGLLSAYSTTGLAGDYIKQTVSSLDITKTYVLSCIAREGTGAAFTIADLGPVFEDAILNFDKIEQIGTTNWYYCEYRVKPSTASGLFGFQVKNNLNFYIDNVHFGLDSYEPTMSSKDLIGSVDVTGDTEYKCLLEVVENGSDYDATAIVNDIEVSGSLTKSEYTFLQKVNFLGEDYKGIKGTFNVNDLKLKWGTDKTLYQLFKFEAIDKDIRNFSDGGKIYGIVESGSNEKGNWIKYEDGTMICSGELADSVISIPFNSLFVKDSYISYPRSFISTPKVLSNSIATTNSPSWASCWGGNKNGHTSRRFSNINTATAKYNYMAVGKWR